MSAFPSVHACHRAGITLEAWRSNRGSGGDGEPHYHQLDGAGRKPVATSDTEVVLVRERDRNGSPQISIATKPRLAEPSSHTYRLSGGEEAD